MRAMRLAASLAVVFAFAVRALPAHAETVNCTAITSVPAVLTLPGIYCFTGSLTTSMTSGNAITVQASNVTIDMNGFRLGGLGAGAGTSAIGISSQDRQNITVRNGTIRGFFTAVDFDSTNSFGPSSQGHLIEDIRADQNTGLGIQVEGVGNILRNNQVVRTGGSTLITGPDTSIIGIVVKGIGNRLLNNDVMTTTRGSAETSAGIVVSSGQSAETLVVGNRITSSDVGIFISGTGKYRDNLTSGVTTPYTGGTDAGNNN